MSKPDDRSDNASKIKEHIKNTEQNIEAADEMISVTSDEKTREELIERNKRREEALEPMEREMEQESNYQKINK